MVIRPIRRGGSVDGLYWGCSRSLVCPGTQRIKSPSEVRPLSADASVEAIFEWERSRERRADQQPVEARVGGLLGIMSRVMPRQAAHQDLVAEHPPASRLASLVTHGFVILDDRRLGIARAQIDHVVIGPTGLFAIARREWRGELSASSDEVYVDGRLRSGATEEAVRAAAALDGVLSHELKPLGIQVRPAMIIERAINPAFSATVGKAIVCGDRSLTKAIRALEPTLGPETVVRLALSADRLLD